MNPVIRLKEPIAICFVTLALTSFGVPLARAVSPPPDGCYPGLTTAEGCNALQSRTTGIGNTGVGWFSLRTVATGSFNTGVGAGTLVSNTADSNTAVGTAALLFNATGSKNTAVGVTALLDNTIGSSNTASGNEALQSNTTGSQNTAEGAEALLSNTTGMNNTATGGGALAGNTTGNGNIALGILAGVSLTTGDNNIDIGNAGVSGESNTIRVGHQGTQTATFIAGISTTPVTGTAVQVTTDGQLGTVTSSERFKKDIIPMEKASEAVLFLRPVTFHYKADPGEIPQFGLIAEEVARINAGLVVRDKEGKPYSVRYDQVNAMLLNEFLKEHRKVQEQETTITQLKSMVEKQEAANVQQQKQIEAVTAGLQRISTQVEMRRTTPQMVVNDQ